MTKTNKEDLSHIEGQKVAETFAGMRVMLVTLAVFYMLGGLVFLGGCNG